MTGVPNSQSLLDLLETLRRAEKEQALFYRALATRAEDSAPSVAQRFHDLHADEQHHLSRLTARILELGGRPVDLSATVAEVSGLDGWEATVAAREAIEIERYRGALNAAELDDQTRILLQEILDVEQHHARELGGKWTMA